MPTKTRAEELADEFCERAAGLSPDDLRPLTLLKNYYLDIQIYAKTKKGLNINSPDPDRFKYWELVKLIEAELAKPT